MVMGSRKIRIASPLSFEAATILTKSGWSSMPPSIMARYGLHLNFLAAELASRTGRK